MRRLSIEALEGRALLAVGDFRLVTYNIAAIDGTPSADLGAILSAIGSETYAGQARPIDILAIQEVETQATTTAAVISQLNSLYGTSVYASGTLNGASTNSFSGDTVGLVYNSESIQLVSEVTVGSVSTSGQPRQTIRYQLRPLGVAPVTDFYLYNSHFKSSDTTADAARRQVEAAAIRANADALPEGTHIIYAGDFNVYTSSEPAFQTLLASGHGQAFDPINRLGSWSDNAAFLDVFTQAPAIVGAGGLADGGLDDRFDFLLHSAEWTDGSSLEYVPASYHSFGNNGSVPINGDINNPNSTALPGLSNRTSILNYLTTVSDHLPVVADFRFASTVAEQFVAYEGGSYSQTFDGLPSSGTYTLAGNGPLFLDSIPIASQNMAGWEMANVGGSSSNARFSVGTGSSTASSIYSFGATNASERGLGSLAASTMIGVFGVNLINTTGATLTSFTLSYVGEQWRNGGSNSADTLAFSYGLGVDNLLNPGGGTFVNESTLDFVSPTVSTTAGALGGNSPENRASRSATIRGIQWLAGQRLVLRWRDIDDSGSDDGLAIDNLTFSASAGEVLARHIYYRGSSFDTSLDSESAIDANKLPLLSGVASNANFTAYARGLTGIIIDVAGLASANLTTADFEFRVGNQSNPASWSMLSPAALLTVEPIVVVPGLGIDGSSRIKVNFADNAIRRSWLQVTLKANANTGLAVSDLFYFGNSPGDILNTSDSFRVNATDVAATRQNAFNIPVSASKAEDLNKDGRVNATDTSIARQQSVLLENLYRLDLANEPASSIASMAANFDHVFATSDDSVLSYPLEMLYSPDDKFGRRTVVSLR